MHALTFCVLMFWFGGVYRARRFPVIGLLLLLFGLLIEAIQPQLSYRDAQSADFLADALGVGCGWLLALTVLGTWCVRAEGWISQLKQRA